MEKLNNVNENEILNAEKLTDEAMADVAGGTAKYYIVKKGDTLTKIANRYGVTRTQLMRWNNRITDPDYIQAGWQIRVG